MPSTRYCRTAGERRVESAQRQCEQRSDSQPAETRGGPPPPQSLLLEPSALDPGRIDIPSAAPVTIAPH